MARRTYAPNNIASLRKARGITQQQLSEKLHSDVTPATVAKLETSQMALSLDYVLDFAQALDVEPTEIIGGAGGMRMVKVLGRIAAGTWAEQVETSTESVPVPVGVGGPNAFALYPDGDSMNLLVADGADGGYLVVDPDDRDLRDGRAYAVQNGSREATFKRYCASPPSLVPCSTNPEHKSIAIGAEPFTVIGRVVFVGQMI